MPSVIFESALMTNKISLFLAEIGCQVFLMLLAQNEESFVLFGYHCQDIVSELLGDNKHFFVNWANDFVVLEFQEGFQA